MTVAELIEELSLYDPTFIVKVYYDDVWTPIEYINDEKEQGSILVW